MIDFAFHALLGALEVSELRGLARRRTGTRLALACLRVALLAAPLALAAARLDGPQHWGFGFLRYASWVVFAHLPLCLAAAAWLLRREARALAALCALGPPALAAIAFDAFLVEPFRLEISRTMLSSPKLAAPLEIALIADLQTDAPGKRERMLFEHVMAEQPDLILFAGDYVHDFDDRRYLESALALNQSMRAARLSAPLGVFAVRGNVEHTLPEAWHAVFRDLPVHVVDRLERIELPGLVLSCLDLDDSSNAQLALPAETAFHIALGHCPDFALGDVRADLLLAGHTHGGQVRLPWLGPVFTLSQVPRAMAAGRSELAGGRTLYVSRGIGMERGCAPRLRFLCEPELAFLLALPAGSCAAGE